MEQPDIPHTKLSLPLGSGYSTRMPAEVYPLPESVQVTQTSAFLGLPHVTKLSILFVVSST
jgi:hypothetical protein